LYFSINLAAPEKDFRKKDKGETKYFKKLKFRIFSSANKAKNKKSKYPLPIILKNVRNELDLKNTPADNRIIEIKIKN
jgi:hypothetical protein